MIEAPVCFNSLRRRAEALFFMSKKRKDIWINKKKGESDLTTEIVFFEIKEKGESFSAFSERFIRTHKLPYSYKSETGAFSRRPLLGEK